MTHYDFEVLEYVPWHKKGLTLPKLSLFQISKKRLIVSTVRAMLSSRAPWAVRNYLAASVLPAFHFFVDDTHPPDFRVSNIRLSYLRDFSLTSRIGEFAQGISYAYWAFGVKAHLCDFVEWSNAKYPGEPLPTRPDFLVAPFSGSQLFVMEAKGTLAHEPTDQMRKAIRQAKGMSSHPALTNAYGTVVTFDAAMGLAARIHIKDPTFEGSPTESDLWEAFRQHYASWYELAGDFERASWLRGEVRGDRVDRVQSDFVRRSTLQALGMEGAEFQLDERIEEALESREVHADGQWREVMASWDSGRLANNQLDFPDGTAISGTPEVTIQLIDDPILPVRT